MKIKKTVKAAYDLFGIDPEEFFTKDDLMELTTDVDSKLPQFGWVSDSWIENNIVHVQYTTEDGYEYNSDIKIDFRKIRKPSDLLKYSKHIAADIENQIAQDYEYEPENAVTSAEEVEDEEISEVEQEYSSADTAINGPQGKLPAVFKMINIPNGSLVLDYGGGKPEAEAVAQAYLDQFDATEAIYDPFNQTQEHNSEVVKMCRANGGADIAVCSNVLNVIKEPEVRLNVLKNIKKLTKPNGSVYITVYEGSGSGEGSATQKNKSYQNNRKTAGYLEEVQQIFPDAKRKGKLILATNSDTSVAAATNTCGIAMNPKVIESVERPIDPEDKEVFYYDSVKGDAQFDIVNLKVRCENGYITYVSENDPWKSGADDELDSKYGLFRIPDYALEEDLLDVISDEIPVEDGDYSISGHVVLIYDIGGVTNGNYEGEYFTDNAELKFNSGRSFIDNINVSRI